MATTTGSDTRSVAPDDRTPTQIEADLGWLHQLREQLRVAYGTKVGGTDLLLAEVREEG